MAAILIPKFNKSALSISAYLLEAGAVTVNGEMLEWQARKGMQVTHCSLTGQWISAGLTPISFMGCNISLFALEMLLDIMLRNSGVAFHRHDTDPPCWRFTPEERTNHRDTALWLCQRVCCFTFLCAFLKQRTVYVWGWAGASVLACACDFHPFVVSLCLLMSCVHARVSRSIWEACALKFNPVMPMMFDNTEMFNEATARGQVLEPTLTHTHTQTCMHEGRTQRHRCARAR